MNNHNRFSEHRAQGELYHLIFLTFKACIKSYQKQPRPRCWWYHYQVPTHLPDQQQTGPNICNQIKVNLGQDQIRENFKSERIWDRPVGRQSSVQERKDNLIISSLNITLIRRQYFADKPKKKGSGTTLHWSWHYHWRRECDDIIRLKSNQVNCSPKGWTVWR